MSDASNESPSKDAPKEAPKMGGMEANFSTLVLSIGSSAAMALGLAPNPMTNKTEKDLNLARFNIDLLRMLRDKTRGNLSADEQKFIESIVTDLQMKFVTAK
jgi:hypothetical protein